MASAIRCSTPPTHPLSRAIQLEVHGAVHVRSNTACLWLGLPQAQLESSSARGAVREEQLASECLRLRAELAAMALANERMQGDIRVRWFRWSAGWWIGPHIGCSQIASVLRCDTVDQTIHGYVHDYSQQCALVPAPRRCARSSCRTGRDELTLIYATFPPMCARHAADGDCCAWVRLPTTPRGNAVHWGYTRPHQPMQPCCIHDAQVCQEQLSDGAARRAAGERHAEELHAAIQALTRSKVLQEANGNGPPEIYRVAAR